MNKAKVIFLMLTTLLVGCIDSREIDHRSMIVGIGIDQLEPELYSVTVQVPILTHGEELSPTGKEFEVFTAVGKTVWDAIAQIEAYTPTVLFFGHLKVVVIGEELARNGIREPIEMLHRNPAIANQVYLLIVEGGAVEEFLKTESPLVTLPALYLNRFFQADQKISRTTDVKLFEFERDIVMTSSAAVIPLASIQEGKIVIENMGVFQDYKLVSKFEGNEVPMSELLKKEETKEFNYTTSFDFKGENLKLALSRSNLKLDISYEKTYPVTFNVHIEGEGEIVEIEGGKHQVTNEFLNIANKQISEELTNVMYETIEKMKKINVDPSLLGHRIWAKDYEYFNELNWEESGWKESKFNITVNYKVENSGQRGTYEKRKIGR